MHIPVGGRGQARKKRHAATSTISASKGEGESASADEIEKCLDAAAAVAFSGGRLLVAGRGGAVGVADDDCEF